jgi:hypothetical protein
MNTNSRVKQTPIPPWLIPNSADWNKVLAHNQRKGMTYRESLLDLWDRRSAYLEQAQPVHTGNEVVTHA